MVERFGDCIKIRTFSGYDDKYDEKLNRFDILELD